MTTNANKRKVSGNILASKGAGLPRHDIEARADFFLSGQYTFAPEIKAADGTPSPPKVTLLANTGVPMELDGYVYPVVVDINGAFFDKPTTPIIMDHDPAKRIGHTTNQRVDNEKVQITADGIVSSDMACAQGFVNDAKKGFPFQVSIGAKMESGYICDEDEKAFVNGRTYSGPLIIATRTRIRELTVCVLGADANTSARLAASDSGPASRVVLYSRRSLMDFEAFVKSLGLEPEKLTDSQRTALQAQWKKTTDLEAKVKEGQKPPEKKEDDPPPEDVVAVNRKNLAAEQRRVGLIEAVVRKYISVDEVEVDGKKISTADFHASAIENGMAPNDFELHMLRASRVTTKAPAGHVVPSIQSLEKGTLACAIVRQSGSVPASRTEDWSGKKWGYEHWYGQKTLEASDDPRLKNLTLHQLMDMTCHAAGKPFWGNRHSDEFIKHTRECMLGIRATAGFTTLDITNIFEDVANKQLLAGFNGVETTWEQIAAPMSVTDFKTYNFYRLNTHGAYEPVGQDGELKHGKFTEEKYSVSAETYGKIVGMTRKNIINDDLGAFNRIMTNLGMEAARTVEELVYVYFLTNLATIFPTDNSLFNYLAGSTYALDATGAGLEKAGQMFTDQVGADNEQIGITPDRILVGTNQKVIATKLFNETVIAPFGGNTKTKDFVNNEYAGLYRPVVSGFLNNTRIKQRVTSIGSAIPGQSSTMWFMLCPPNLPQGSLLLVPFLNGNRTPFLDQADMNFNVLGMEWRAYHDVGVGTGDKRLGVMVKGAT